MKALFGIVFLPLIGCAAPHSDHFDVYVKTEMAKGEVFQALDHWTESVGVRFNTIITDDTSHCGNDNTICIAGASLKELADQASQDSDPPPPGTVCLGHTHQTDNAFQGDHSYVFIYRNAKGDELYRLTLHEIGHALSLVHIHENNHVMTPITNYQSDALTCKDKWQYFFLRGLNPKKCEE